VTDWAFCERLVADCVREFGRIDGLVNNAGLFYVVDPWEDDEVRIRRLVEVNVLGTMFCGVHALRQMVRQGYGSIVNITSGAHTGLSRMAAYAGTKGAVASWTYSAAMDAMQHNVRVNAVSPIGMTRMALAASGAEMSDRVEAPGAASISRPELAPENVAPLVTYLLSDLSDGITGQVVRLQGHELSLIEHPVIVEPPVRQQSWTTESVAAAFEQTLRAQLRPVGLGRPTYEWDPGVR
jgi:NAD(P)-dependent dehydrogenase (short-subunit alcohol dehydrogenase family)